MRYLGDFARDEGGSVTLWNLLWFTGFCALLGMGMDTSSAHSTKAQLQNTADAAAHAAIIDLLDPLDTRPLADRIDTARATALAYGATNMPVAFYGDVVVDSDVSFGFWRAGAFTEYVPAGEDTVGQGDAGEPNAVRVISRRVADRGNSLATSFLRVVGLYNWDIDGVAVATADLDGVADCREYGIISGQLMEQTSNNAMVNFICLHGQQEIKLAQNNLIECGVEISTLDPGTGIKGAWAGTLPSTPCSPDPGNPAYANPLVESEETMLRHALTDNDLPSTAQVEFDAARDILYGHAGGYAVDDPFGVIPDWIDRVVNTDKASFNALESYDPGTLYEVDCTGGGAIDIGGIVLDVAIVTDCEIDFRKSGLDTGDGDKPGKGGGKPGEEVVDPEEPVVEEGDATYVATDGNTYPIEPGASVVLDNVVILSTATGNNAVKFSQGLQAGRKDGCTAGGGVRMYLAGDLKSPSDSSWFGAQLISLGEVDLAAKTDGVWGINIEAAGDVKYAAQGRVGACNYSGDESDAVFTWRDYSIRLVY